jgi:hypothetical protein
VGLRYAEFSHRADDGGSNLPWSRLGGVMVSVFAIGPEVRGFITKLLLSLRSVCTRVHGTYLNTAILF